MDVWLHDRTDHQERFKKVGEHGRGSTKLPVTIREVLGNLRFPLDKTYHGCPQNSLMDAVHKIVRGIK
jgi:hypothetical protein